MSRADLLGQLRAAVSAAGHDAVLRHQAGAAFLLDVMGVDEPSDDAAEFLDWFLAVSDEEGIVGVALLIETAVEVARSVAVALEQENHHLGEENQRLITTLDAADAGAVRT